MTSFFRIQDLDTQIHFLQSRKKKLEDRRNKQIISILHRCGAIILPDDVLAGGLLDIVDHYNQKNHSRVDQWQQAGLKVLKPGRGRKKTASS